MGSKESDGKPSQTSKKKEKKKIEGPTAGADSPAVVSSSNDNEAGRRSIHAREQDFAEIIAPVAVGGLWQYLVNRKREKAKDHHHHVYNGSCPVDPYNAMYAFC